MRLVPLLAAGCAATGPGSPRPEALLKDDGSEPVITALCASADCRTLWATLLPPPEAPATWTLDGEVLGELDGVEFELGEGGARVVGVELPDGDGAEAWVEDVGFEVPGDEPSATVVILGAGSSCERFSVVTVGGCVFAGTDLWFVPQAGAGLPTGFSTVPPGLRQMGHATNAWWPGGSSASAAYVPTHGGYEYWFRLSPNRTLSLTAFHGWYGGSATGRALPTATCTVNGTPVIGPPPPPSGP